MKKTLVFIILVTSSILGHAENSFFFLSSDKIFQEKQGSLKGLSSFTFFPLLKSEEKDARKIFELIDRELKKTGHVVMQPVLTPEGADLSAFSHPALQFSIEQLTDQNNNPLPVLHAILSLQTRVELSKTKESSFITTNCWSIYLKKTDDVQEVIKKTLPALLQQFLTDFQSENTGAQKPIFYITYDASWGTTTIRK